MATKEQLRKLRKKYHLGEFRTNRKVNKHRRVKHSMAKKRRSSRRSSGFSSGGIWGQVLGIGAYVMFEQYLEPMIPLQEPILSFSELAVSYWLSKKSGFVGNFGKAGVYINGYQLIKYFAGQTLGGVGRMNTVTDAFAMSF